MTSAVSVERDGNALVITIDAIERRNALSRPLLYGLADAIAGIDDDITGIVITGAGETFSAGADFAELTGTSADADYDDVVGAVAAAVTGSPVPVAAALEGPCVGAAAHLALVCDVRIAGKGSWIQVPAVRLGLLYSPQAVKWLARRYPSDSVRRLLLLAERFGADEARRAGFVSTVVPNGTACDHAVTLLGANGIESRGAITLTRQLLNSVELGDYDDAVWQQRRRELLDSPERRRAVDDAKLRHGATSPDNSSSAHRQVHPGKAAQR
ncbi:MULTISPECIES: enoyl-CoA hydratase/isomerase family protein [Gordonia]|jgi:enoyl-CoA hydratase/carnithine racemase|uniref:Enoyl-CoA hydratase n=1 Tax=Gordonia alkanivorans CGMCC 6845 TaxID=1423140 RepID=W9D7K4_9ACTN|nr:MULTISPECIES: enoyl-CoA hydratase/isomerase family protein [Gordonia]ETA05253.1 enoyl-CoA hydratase [Gordonia alkanivorans CGMCC 6845]MDH3008402.1 enoyl-CoA hydratase/isomerase family protein [Gordonia alkanivorans]MDH3013888.1 enoyl-CoA hydratase/isomerase family protein [Gordonia alkanivorans]MDH3015668.1 enoyl-CoA hydratase/isomerase family protein [Gordonia alkanivorans]MDH3022676.1 enoyl-CoA hydratase/isomerase family protein [Gordonia alkanivorans]